MQENIQVPEKEVIDSYIGMEMEHGGKKFKISGKPEMVDGEFVIPLTEIISKNPLEGETFQRDGKTRRYCGEAVYKWNGKSMEGHFPVVEVSDY